MDRQLKRLVERLLNDYNARPLNENIFQKLNAVYGNQPAQKNLGKIYKDAMDGVVQPLISSVDRQDIRNFFIDTFKLDSIIKDMVNITMEYINGRQGNIEYYERFNTIVGFTDLPKFLAEELSDMYRDQKNVSISQSGYDIQLNCRAANITHYLTIKIGPENSFGNSALSELNISTKSLKFSTSGGSLGRLICNWTPDRGASPKKAAVAKAVADFNANQNLLGEKFDKFLNDIVDKEFNVDRLEEELFCQEKVYKVVDKDIMRQANIFNHGSFKGNGSYQLAGFKAITNPAKMAARAAATFICAHYMKVSDMELKVDDDTLIRLFTNDQFIGDSRFDCENLLSYIRYDLKDGARVHLKDVIATFLAYKDDPKILESLKKHC